MGTIRILGGLLNLTLNLEQLAFLYIHFLRQGARIVRILKLDQDWYTDE